MTDFIQLRIFYNLTRRIQFEQTAKWYVSFVVLALYLSVFLVIVSTRFRSGDIDIDERERSCRFGIADNDQTERTELKMSHTTQEQVTWYIHHWDFPYIAHECCKAFEKFSIRESLQFWMFNYLNEKQITYRIYTKDSVLKRNKIHIFEKDISQTIENWFFFLQQTGANNTLEKKNCTTINHSTQSWYRVSGIIVGHFALRFISARTDVEFREILVSLDQFKF